MVVELPPLPYSMDALEPNMSRETLEYHYGKHHAGYVDKLNNALQEEQIEDKPLEELVSTTSGDMFNNAAQVWNHTFFWNCMRAPQEHNAPEGELLSAIDDAFGSFEGFKERFEEAAKSVFGSGWTWLIHDRDGRLDIITTSDAETPASDPLLKALLTVDMWEHAYYIDYRNEKGDYLAAFWDLVNWSFVATNNR